MDSRKIFSFKSLCSFNSRRYLFGGPRFDSGSRARSLHDSLDLVLEACASLVDNIVVRHFMLIHLFTQAVFLEKTQLQPLLPREDWSVGARGA